MADRGARVLIDTNAIIAAHSVACWNEITGFFSVETVEECVEECGRGRQRRRNYIPVDVSALCERVGVHHVNDEMRARLTLAEPTAADLDAGERDLLSYAFAVQEIDYIICSPDVACMKVAARLSMEERLVSLESLLADSGGGGRNFRDNFTESWHRKTRSRIMLELLI